jgi:hypothetical protein
MTQTNTYVFVLFSSTSRNSPNGLSPQVSRMSEAQIIECAEAEMRRSGESFEDMAGVPWSEGADGSLVPARELGLDEVFALAVEKLGDDGRLFQIFDADDVDAGAAFILAAALHGVEDEARELVRRRSRDWEDMQFYADDLIQEHAEDIARAEEEARAERDRRDAELRAHLENLPVIYGCSVEKGKYGSRNRNGYRVYLDLVDGRYRRCTIVYSREIPGGSSPEGAVAVALARWAASANA